MCRRRYAPDVLFEVMQRTNRGECLLDCNDESLRDEINGVLAVGQERFGVKVYAYHFMANHYHGLFGAPTPQKFADFLCHFHAGVARAVNRRLDLHGHVWGGRAHVIPVIPDEATLIDRLRYIMGQATKAGLSAHPCEFPGASSARWMAAGEPIVGALTDWTARCRDQRLKAGPGPESDYQTTPTVHIRPLPCWADLRDDELHAAYRDQLDDLATTRAKAPSCQIVEDIGELTERAPVPAAVDDAGRPRVVGDVRSRGPMPRVFAPSEATRKEFEAVLDAFEEEYDLARLALNRQAKRVGGVVRLRLVRFPAYALVGGGVRAGRA